MSTDDQSLICPITQEYFRDPVIAEDGRLYEREAITQWIKENGTSPFTRQVLNVNHLQPDDQIRRRADQERRLSVSYNHESDQVHLPPIRPSREISLNTVMVDVGHPRESSQRRTYCENIQNPNMRSGVGNTYSLRHLRSSRNAIGCCCVMICIIISVIILSVVVAATRKSSTSFTTKQSVTRPHWCNPLDYSTRTTFERCFIEISLSDIF